MGLSAFTPEGPGSVLAGELSSCKWHDMATNKNNNKTKSHTDTWKGAKKGCL